MTNPVKLVLSLAGLTLPARVMAGQTVQLLINAQDAVTARPMAATGLVVTVRESDGQATDITAAVENPADGNWQVNFTLGKAGGAVFRVTCSGPTTAVEEQVVLVRASNGAAPPPLGAVLVPTVTDSANGLMLATDKAKLDAVAAGATRVTTPGDIGAAPLASPAFTGAPTAPTPATADNSTKVATTAWVVAQGYGGAAVTSVAGRTGAVTLAVGDVSGAAAASDLATEATARSNGDATNAAAITAEATARAAADTAEATARSTGDATNAAAITAEAATARAAELTATLLAAMASGAAASTTTIGAGTVTDAYSYGGTSWTVTTTIGAGTITEVWSAPFSVTHVTTLASGVVTRT